MANLTLKLPVDSADEMLGGILPMTPRPATAPLLPMQPPGSMPMPRPMPAAAAPVPMSAPDIDSGALPPIPSTDIGQPAGPPGSVDYLSKQYQSQLSAPKPGLLGRIAGTALSALAPGVAALIPSTPLGRIAQQNRTLAQLETAQQQQRQAQQEASEEGLKSAQAEEAQARAQALAQPPPKETEKLGATVDTGDGVFQWNPETERYDIKVGPSKATRQPLGTAEEQGYQEALKKTPSLTRTQFHAQWEAAGKPAAEDTKADARLDRSYQFNSTQMEKLRTPIEATMGKISASLSNLNLQSPQADALLAPQILSIAAGGTGSGLRMNEAEISRIVGGRTAWESLQAAINKWNTDPSHPAIPAAQRQQMAAILNAAMQKGQQKEMVLEWGEQALIDATDPTTHRKVVAQVHQLMDAVDQGKPLERNKKTGALRIAAEPAK